MNGRRFQRRGRGFGNQFGGFQRPGFGMGGWGGGGMGRRGMGMGGMGEFDDEGSDDADEGTPQNARLRRQRLERIAQRLESLLEKIRGQIERLEVEEAEQVLETESESDATPETPEQNPNPQAAVAKTLK